MTDHLFTGPMFFKADNYWFNNDDTALVPTCDHSAHRTDDAAPVGVLAVSLVPDGEPAEHWTYLCHRHADEIAQRVTLGDGGAEALSTAVWVALNNGHDPVGTCYECGFYGVTGRRVGWVARQLGVPVCLD